MKLRLIILIFLLSACLVSASNILKQGEAYEIGSRQLVVESIRGDKVKIDVDGIKNIVSINEEKEINKVKIRVQDIFYVDEAEGRFVTLVVSMSFYCGDGNCDSEEGEDKEGCCRDCGCDAGFECEDGRCKKPEVKLSLPHECKVDGDCDDNDENTMDFCRKITGESRRCVHWSSDICQSDGDCEDNNPCTNDECVSKDCFFTDIPDCGKKEVGMISEDEEPYDKAEEPEKVLVEKKLGLFGRMFSFFLSFF